MGPIRVVAVGEVLWDVFGKERHLGGAPFNFTYICHALGAEARIISRIGNDELGHEILERTHALGMPLELIQIDSEHPTGTVEVTLGPGGSPSYQIHEHVAWDYIEFTPEAEEAVAQADIVCFGSLAQRSEVSRCSIRSALADTKRTAKRVMDINLRQHYYSNKILRQSLDLTDLLKINEQELTILQDMLALPPEPESAVAELMTQFELSIVAISLGAGGARAWSREELAQAPPIAVHVRDTVGSGDAFSAVLALETVAGAPLHQALNRANLAGAYLATQAGATPPISRQILKEFAAGRW